MTATYVSATFIISSRTIFMSSLIDIIAWSEVILCTFLILNWFSKFININWAWLCLIKFRNYKNRINSTEEMIKLITAFLSSSFSLLPSQHVSISLSILYWAFIRKLFWLNNDFIVSDSKSPELLLGLDWRPELWLFYQSLEKSITFNFYSKL